MTDLRALLGDKYDDVIEKARLAIEDELIEYRDAGIFVPNNNGLTVNNRDGSRSDIRRMSTAMGVHTTLATVLPDLLAEAWEEGHIAGCADPYSAYRECICGPNPYRCGTDGTAEADQ